MNLKHIGIFWGKVIRGKKRGKSLGFPTANVKLHRNFADGIYISLATVDKRSYPALTFIGAAKTFGERDVKAETYLFLFEENIYGKRISVRLLKKIRANQSFKSERDLIIQMNKDKQKALEYFKTSKYV